LDLGFWGDEKYDFSEDEEEDCQKKNIKSNYRKTNIQSIYQLRELRLDFLYNYHLPIDYQIMNN